MITDRDKQIIRYFEQYKYATIEQLQKIFFKNQQSSYGIARKRLERLKEAGYIKALRDSATNRNIYIWNDEKIKPPSLHRMITLDVLAELYRNDCQIELFQMDKNWCDREIRSDAFAIFVFQNRRYHLFFEIQLSNHNHNLEKYDTLYETWEVQNYLNKDHFPRIVLVTDKNYSKVELKHTQVILLNTKLEAFSKVLL
ncbi:MAG TPA: hypothetical protein VEF53_18875 [Patescibacteria group bacterium]|nr:hypothetical protein [Patescibacteria group bacterium]